MPTASPPATCCRALDLQKSLAARRQAAPSEIAAAEDIQPAAASGSPPPAEARPTAENVTPLTLGDRKRSDP